MGKIKYRKPVFITNEHLERYRELASKGVIRPQAIKMVQREFNMPESHTEQAVRAKCQKAGILFRKGKGGRGQTVGIRTNHEPTWEQVRDFILTAIEKADKVPELEKEIQRLRTGYELMAGQLKIAEKAQKKADDEERRYKLALQQGDIKTPLSKPSFTEHIALYDPKSISEMPDLPNISLCIFCFN